LLNIFGQYVDYKDLVLSLENLTNIFNGKDYNVIRKPAIVNEFAKENELIETIQFKIYSEEGFIPSLKANY
jgi:hypothetical protein